MYYREVSQIISDRRKGENLSVIIEKLLKSPRSLQDQIENPFEIIEDLYPEDYVDTSTDAWFDLPVELQMKISGAYQRWYARLSGHADIEGQFELTPGVFMPLMLIPPMKCYVGSYADHGLPITLHFDSFWIGKFEVTQKDWNAVMPHTNRSAFQGDEELPVDSVNHAECMEFCKRTSMKLPSEERWEMACRAGTSTRYSFGDDSADLKLYAWYSGNSDGYTHVVGEKKPNAWGLYDMHGNVSELCGDRFIRSIPAWYVSKGGNWESHYLDCASASRFGSVQPVSSRVGFRVFRENQNSKFFK